METFIKYCALCGIKEYSKNKQRNQIMIERLLQSHINYYTLIKSEKYLDMNQN